MKEYHKIETLFERDMEGNKKLIEGKFRNKAIEFTKDNEWIFTEKIDGTNIRIHWDGHKVYFGGRTENAQIPSPLLNDVLVPTFLGFKNEELFEQRFGDKEVILFGEGFGGKIQAGGNYGDTDFILFDVMVGDIWLDREEVESIAKMFNLKVVPVIDNIKTIQQAIDYIKTKPLSVVAKEQYIMEGVVGRPRIEIKDKFGQRLIVKIKVCDF